MAFTLTVSRWRLSGRSCDGQSATVSPKASRERRDRWGRERDCYTAHERHTNVQQQYNTNASCDDNNMRHRSTCMYILFEVMLLPVFGYNYYLHFVVVTFARGDRDDGALERRCWGSGSSIGVAKCQNCCLHRPLTSILHNDYDRNRCRTEVQRWAALRSASVAFVFIPIRWTSHSLVA